MICIQCGERYAPFPKGDFVKHPVLGFVARDQEAILRRAEVFDSDEKGYCGYCGCDDEEPPR